MPSRRLLVEALKAGSVGAFAMPIAGTLTKPFFGWHVWQYGKRFAQLFVENATPGLLLVQHLLWSWGSALLLIALLRKVNIGAPVLLSAVVGGIYYFLVNAVALPLYFGDPMPWRQGLAYVVQPLVVLVAFAVCVSLVARRYVRSEQRGG